VTQGGRGDQQQVAVFRQVGEQILGGSQGVLMSPVLL
jgi:hypothetical protein